MILRWTHTIIILLIYLIKSCVCNLPPVFTQDMNNLALSEAIPVGTIVYTLEGYDPEGSPITFGLLGSDNFAVDPITGQVKVIKPLDRELQDTLSFLVTIKDQVNVTGGDSQNDNYVKVSINVIVLDENDNAPEFRNVPYETEVSEEAEPGTMVFDSILLTDTDSVGDILNITCIPQSRNSNACNKFSLEIIESNQNQLKAAVVLKDKLDYNEQMIYHIILSATDGAHTTNEGLEIRVKDVQNSPPIFQGSLAAVIDEDCPIGTLVMIIQAKDGDRGQPRKIVYDLLINPMEYFLLDSKSGELRTAKPLDKESLPDATGLVVLTIRARELINGTPGMDELTTATAQASVTIRDVNDSPPEFNQKNYFVSLSENTPHGTPLPLDINVRDPDVGTNSIFSLRLDDVSNVFDVEPKLVMGSSQVSIRVANGSLDYENPNQRKFIVLIIAEETQTKEKLSSTATLTVAITDANDNRPIFDEESYSISVSETANTGQLITTITAKDLDSGKFGDHGIRYSLSGTGSHLFHVDNITGAITVAMCPVNNQNVVDDDDDNNSTEQRRKRRQINVLDLEETGFGDEEQPNESEEMFKTSTIHNNIESNTELTNNDLIYNEYNTETIGYNVENNKDLMETIFDMKPIKNLTDHRNVETNDVIVTLPTPTENIPIIETTTITSTPPITTIKPGQSPCLDFETQNVYFLSYKATDDDGKGQTSVVSLRISLLDANDSPPICESTLYRASLDEGAKIFDPPLQIRARDPDTISDINYKINGNEMVSKLFYIDSRSGQLFIKNTTTLDVNHLKSENVFFSVQASDGLYTTLCDVNITIRDVNNHAPQFSRDNFVASIAENSPIGTTIDQINATDLDSGINAAIGYRIQQGSFDDFLIDNKTGLITIGRKLDYDRRNTYHIEIVASDLGTPSLSGTATLTITIINSNDKDPYFTPATQRAEVLEDAPIGTLVHSLIAIDPDITTNEALDYAATEPITAVDKDGKEIFNTDEFKYLFDVDRTGKVTVNKKLNRDNYAVIRITVLVTDTTAPITQQGKGLLVITIIDVNDLPPTFAPPWTPSNPKLMFKMLEEQPIGSMLTNLQATDIDSNIEAYSLEENDYFEINNLTGLIRTKSRIDYETIKEIKLIANVTDTGIPQLTSTAQLIIDIVNENDNEPMFKSNEYNMSVVENSPKGTVIGKIEANDNDDGLFGEITYSLVGQDSKHFNIDHDSGIITVANTSFLDRERQSDVSLSGVASDKAPITTRKSTTVPVHIQILDVNDNFPKFDQTTYQASIAENVAVYPPAAILQVHAIDADDEPFGTVKYFIVSHNADLFRLDPDSGILYPRQSLKGMKGDYNFEVEARDGAGAGPFADKANIYIEILSINSYRPEFIMPALTNASVELNENLVKTNYLVMTVKAMDNDTGDNGKIKYHLQVNNQNVQETVHFVIDENTGELRTKHQLDRKEQSKYELVLVVRDQGMPAAFETLRFLTINLVDANENKPEFPEASNPYQFLVIENSPKDVRIGKIQAFVKDNNNNNNQHQQQQQRSIYYYMILGNENSAFYLDKNTGDLYTNKSLDREIMDYYHLFILASKKSDLHISEAQRSEFSVKGLERDSTIAKVIVQVLDVNDNPPIFEKSIYYAGVNSKSPLNQLIAILNATDLDMGINGTFDLMIVASNLYKFGATKSTGSIVPSPFAISKEGRLVTATFIAEYNQDRFELDVVAKEIAPPEREATAKIYVWVFNSDQLVRVILSRPPAEVHLEQDEIITELRNATQKRIIIDEIRYHVDSMGRIRMDWCDLFFHCVDPISQTIVPVDDVLKVIDSHYDFLKDYYAGFAIENVVPAHSTYVEEEFDLALAGLVALLIVLFVGAISFLVLCCCLKHWSMSIPMETRRKDALIKKQFVEDLSTTENPLWIEQKLKLYEEQELTMQVFSEPEITQIDTSQTTMDRRDSYDTSQMGDNTYATIQPRNLSQLGEVADYATLRNNSRAPSIYEFTGSTFQAPLRNNREENYVAELI